MTNYEFREKLMEELRNRMPGVAISPCDIKENNAVTFFCIEIKDGSHITPYIYTEGLYCDYQYGSKSMREIVDSILRYVQESKDMGYFDSSKNFGHLLSEIFDYSKTRFKLAGRLVNTGKNRIALAEMPHREFLDLSIIYFVDVPHDDGNGCMSIRVTNKLMAQWDMSEDRLYEQVMENMEQGEKGMLWHISEVLRDTPYYGPDIMNVQMYICSNKMRLNGAVEILDKKVMEKAGERLKDDFYILPSSVHEVILIPISAGGTADGLATNVQIVNDSEVNPTEILSYHVYRYYRESQKIEIVE